MGFFVFARMSASAPTVNARIGGRAPTSGNLSWKECHSPSSPNFRSSLSIDAEPEDRDPGSLTAVYLPGPRPCEVAQTLSVRWLRHFHRCYPELRPNLWAPEDQPDPWGPEDRPNPWPLWRLPDLPARSSQYRPFFRAHPDHPWARPAQDRPGARQDRLDLAARPAPP